MFYFIRKSNKIWWIFFKKILCSHHCFIHLWLPTEMHIKIAQHTHKWRLPREKLAFKDSLCLYSWTQQTSWSWPEKAPGRILLVVCSFFLLEQNQLVKSDSMLPSFFTSFLWTQRSKEYTIWKLGSFPVPHESWLLRQSPNPSALIEIAATRTQKRKVGARSEHKELQSWKNIFLILSHTVPNIPRNSVGSFFNTHSEPDHFFLPA